MPRKSKHPLLTSRTCRVLLVTIGHAMIEDNAKIAKCHDREKKETLMISLYVMVKYDLEQTRTSITLEMGSGA